LVVLRQFESVKLMEGLDGNCCPCLPQYLTSAILDGDDQVWVTR